MFFVCPSRRNLLLQNLFIPKLHFIKQYIKLVNFSEKFLLKNLFFLSQLFRGMPPASLFLPSLLMCFVLFFSVDVHTVFLPLLLCFHTLILIFLVFLSGVWHSVFLSTSAIPSFDFSRAGAASPTTFPGGLIGALVTICSRALCWVTLSGAQDLLFCLHSGITSGNAQGTI